MVKRNTNYLLRYEDIIDKLSKKYQVPVEEVKDVIDYFFVTFKENITDPRMPTIKISNLGTFRPTIGRFKWHIRSIRSNYRRKRISREAAHSRLAYIWPVYRRLILEKCGHSTWKEWRDMYKHKKDESKKESKKQIIEGESSKGNNSDT